MTAPVLAALGLAVRFPDVVLEKVDPGTVFNFRQDRNLPYVVINKCDVPADVAVEVEAPAKGVLKEGYEPIPDTTWIKVVPNKFHMEVGDVASADVVMSIPNDPKWVGRHFQADLRAHTVNSGFLAVAVMNPIRMSIGTAGPDALKHDAALKTFETLDLDLTPQSVKVEGAPLGRKLALKELKAGPLKITNRGGDAVKLRLLSVAVDNNLKNPEYEAAPDPKWLTVKPAVLKIKENRIEEAQLFLEIPQTPENKGRKFMFVVRGELEGMDFPLAINSRIYVTTEGEPVKKP